VICIKCGEVQGKASYKGVCRKCSGTKPNQVRESTKMVSALQETVEPHKKPLYIPPTKHEIEKNLESCIRNDEDIPFTSGELFVIHKCRTCETTKLVVSRLGMCMGCLDKEYMKLVTRKDVQG